MWSAARVDRKKKGFPGLKRFIKKSLFIQIENFFQRFIAWNVGSDGKIKIDAMGTYMEDSFPLFNVS